MQYKTYEELIVELHSLLPGWEIVLGTTKDDINGNTCFLNHSGSTTTYADNVPFITSSTYDIIFIQKRSAFTNKGVIELLDNGVDFTVYDENTGMNIFTGAITLFGPRSLPDD